MNRKEQDVYLSKWYAEVNRYMDNAEDALKKATKRDNGYYGDKKYVETACGVAYKGVLYALDAWFKLKDVPEPAKKKNKSIEFYMSNLAVIDNKMVSCLNSAYNVLHLDGYYRGETSVKIIEGGFDAAYKIIEKIKPENFVPADETRGQEMKDVGIISWFLLLCCFRRFFFNGKILRSLTNKLY